MYTIGCILAFIFLTVIYKRTDRDARCDYSEACVIYFVGTICSWLTVTLILLAAIFNLLDKK